MPVDYNLASSLSGGLNYSHKSALKKGSGSQVFPEMVENLPVGDNGHAGESRGSEAGTIYYSRWFLFLLGFTIRVFPGRVDLRFAAVVLSQTRQHGICGLAAAVVITPIRVYLKSFCLTSEGPVSQVLFSSLLLSTLSLIHI